MRVHLRAPAYYGSRPLCGLTWTESGDLRVTRDRCRVTCRRCLRRMERLTANTERKAAA